MRTHIRFDSEMTFELTEQAVTAFAGYSSPEGWSVRGSAGAIVDGKLDAGAGAHDFAPGVVVAVGASRQWTRGSWFVTGSAGLSVATAATHLASESARFVAGDVRGGAIAGRTFAKIVSPYVLARAFGGPVLWAVDGADVTGTDTRHFQLGAGLSAATPIGLTFVVDVSVLGEQAASLGASWRL